MGTQIKIIKKYSGILKKGRKKNRVNSSILPIPISRYVFATTNTIEKNKKEKKKRGKRTWKYTHTHVHTRKKKEKRKKTSNGCQHSVVANEALINPFIERTAHFFQRIKSELTTKNTQPLFWNTFAECSMNGSFLCACLYLVVVMKVSWLWI